MITNANTNSLNSASAFPAACGGVSEQNTGFLFGIGDSSRLAAKSFNAPPKRSKGLLQLRMKGLAFQLMTGCLFVLLVVPAVAQKPAKPLSPIRLEGSKLVYEQDGKGNRVPDFSFCGYEQSELPIPVVPARIFVPVQTGDATARIQAALDYVATLIPDADGFRGAVLLEKGTYEVAGSLSVNASGIVLRGSGMNDNETILLATGQDRETLIQIKGKDDRYFSNLSGILDESVPVNATSLRVKSGVYKTGDKIQIHRPSTEEWIDATGTGHFGGGITTLGWKPGNQDINWERTLIKVQGNQLVFDVPITTELDKTYGLSTVSLLTWPGRISACGVENLQLVSAWDETNPKDENHRWMAITLENCQNAWIRRITFRHFAGSAVYLLETASQVTVEDCQSFEPVSEIGGYRRYTFYNEGQLNLFQRLYAEYGYHDFATGHCTAGPNAFVQCYSHLPFGFSGTLDSWASGVLFDIVTIDGQALGLKNRGQDGQGAGWTGANSVFWQCSAALIECPKPPTAQNWAFGSWSQFQGDGCWVSSNDNVEPRSLYYGQLEQRLDRKVNYSYIQPVSGEPSSSPSFEVAQEMSDWARQPDMQLTDWINWLINEHPLPTDKVGLMMVNNLKVKPVRDKPTTRPLQVKNGWLVLGDQVVTGSRQGVTWWKGNLKTGFLASVSAHITRYVPGRTGLGFTDDLQALTDTMKMNQVAAIDHNYCLWYDRRRDDHEHIRRLDGDVWAPFYELPFARSGKGQAYDGLSQYDLTKWNVWYWKRLKTFADLADQKGLILFHQNYFQHNLLEASAHWTDFPWRTANNVNNTPFPEPVNYAGDKRVFMAEQFYDVSDSAYKALHRNYIRKCLDNFKDNSNTIQFISAEYTGPQSFVEFWLDVIAEWEKETGKKVLVALSTTKDVQDAILADTTRSKLIDVIDTKYWKYQPEGGLYAPAGGKHLAPRQHDRLKVKGLIQQSGNPPSERTQNVTDPAELIYWTVRDYRDTYKDKAVLFSSDVSHIGWPAFMAGGSVCTLPAGLTDAFKQSAVQMRPIDPDNGANYWLLGNPEIGYMAYVKSGSTIRLELKEASGRFNAQWLDTRSGIRIGSVFKVSGGKEYVGKVPAHSFAMLWLYR